MSIFPERALLGVIRGGLASFRRFALIFFVPHFLKEHTALSDRLCGQHELTVEEHCPETGAVTAENENLGKMSLRAY